MPRECWFFIAPAPHGPEARAHFLARAMGVMFTICTRRFSEANGLLIFLSLLLPNRQRLNLAAGM